MLRRILLFGAMIALVVFSAAPAWAHVTVQPEEATKGTDAVLTFTVPNEKDSADTTQLVIAFPKDHPIADASVAPVAGWTANVEKTQSSKPIQTDKGTVNQAVSQITWSGGAIKPGQFEQFKVSVGLPGDADSLVFKALQTYSDGDVVRWIDLTAPGGPEPANPAPTLKLTAATSNPNTPATTGTATAKTKNSSSDDTARTLGIIGIAAGALGLLAGSGALTRARRT